MAWREQLSVGELTTTSQSKCTFGTGTKEGVTVAFKNAYQVAERGTDVVHKTVFTFTDSPVTLDDTGVGEGIKIYTFPDGYIQMLGGAGTMAMTTTSVLATTLNASSTVGWGVGTTTQANGTLATTEQDLINVANITSSATINVASATVAGQADLNATAFDGTSTAIAAFLNFGVPTATDIDANATVTITGSVALFWVNLGDV
jgi:hypothetical protein